MRRWAARRLITARFVEFNGSPWPRSRGDRSAVRLAGLSGRAPHTLRHTVATCLTQRREPIWVAAGFLGMSSEVLQETYGHHPPDFLQGYGGGCRSKGPVRFSGRIGG